MREERFPLVSDDEVMLTEMPVMDLYDESDLYSVISRENTVIRIIWSGPLLLKKNQQNRLKSP